MRHAPVQFSPTGNTHVTEEIMRPFSGIIVGRILCGGLRDKNTYEVPLLQHLATVRISREKWFDKVERLSDITCKKCAQRHNRWMDDYEAAHAAEVAESVKFPGGLQIALDECVLNMSGTCLRTDEAHANTPLPIPEKAVWWACPARQQ